MSRTLATFTLLGTAASAWLFWTFDRFWPAFDGWDRVLAVLLALAVWGVVAASVATVRQALKRTDLEPHGAVREAREATRGSFVSETVESGVATPDARGGGVKELESVLA